MPENINEQLNIADANGGKNNEGGESSRLKLEVSRIIRNYLKPLGNLTSSTLKLLRQAS